MGNNSAKLKGLGGLCGTDYFQKMKDKYGDDAVKFIVVLKCKEYVNTRFSEIGLQLNGLFSDAENKTTRLADDKAREINEAFEKMKKDIDHAVPNGVQKLQSSRGQALEHIIDLQKYTSLIIEAKERTLNQIHEQRNSVNDDMRAKHKMVIDSIDRQCPSIPIYYDMPESSQNQILRKGEQQFSPQIESKKEVIGKQIDQQIDVDSIKMRLMMMVPVNEMNELANTPKSVFSVENGITGEVIERLRVM